MIRENKGTTEKEMWTIICDECGTSLSGPDENSIMQAAAFAGKWLGGFMKDGRLLVGSLYNKATKLQLCSLRCALTYRKKHNF